MTATIGEIVLPKRLMAGRHCVILIRTKPIHIKTTRTKYRDRSYTTSPVFLVQVKPNGVMCIDTFSYTAELDPLWNDGHWRPATEQEIANWIFSTRLKERYGV